MDRVQIEPAVRAVDVTPADDRDLVATTADNGGKSIPYARCLRVLTTGNVKITTMGGDVRTYTGLAAGTRLDWVSVARVWATGTTATVEALY